MEINKIYCIDCIEGIKQLDDSSIDLVIADPPYGVTDLEWDKKHREIIFFTKKWWNILRRKSYCFYIFWSQKYLREAYSVFNPNRILIWWHPNLAKPTSAMWLWTYDPILYINTGCSTFNGNFGLGDNSDVLKYAKPQSNWCNDKKIHPTQKPIELIKRIIKVSSNRGNIILDPFMGSGTTAVACKQLERNFIGFDNNPEYVELANKRISKVQIAMFN